MWQGFTSSFIAKCTNVHIPPTKRYSVRLNITRQPLLLRGNQINPYDFFGIETLRTHVLMNCIIRIATVNPIGFSILHMNDMVVDVDRLE